VSVTKDFVAKLAVGVRGYALMEITETLSPHSVCVGNDICGDLIASEISDIGIDEWVEYSLPHTPVDVGMYTLRGSARFDEDSSDYSVSVNRS